MFLIFLEVAECNIFANFLISTTIQDGGKRERSNCVIVYLNSYIWFWFFFIYSSWFEFYFILFNNFNKYATDLYLLFSYSIDNTPLVTKFDASTFIIIFLSKFGVIRIGFVVNYFFNTLKDFSYLNFHSHFCSFLINLCSSLTIFTNSLINLL